MIEEKKEGLGKMFPGKLKLGDTLIPCAVLPDGRRVISETGITKAILGTRSGGSRRLKRTLEEAGTPIPLFLAPPNLKDLISGDLWAGPLAPIEYQDGERVTKWYEATLLPTVCDIWLKAREAGLLRPSQYPKAQKAEVLMRGLAHVGIIALVDEATGYQEIRDRDELNRILEAYVNPELLPWAKTFPDEYYKQLFRLHGWQYSPISVKRPQLLGKRTNEIIYDRLPPGVKDELKKRRDQTPKESKPKLFQHLTPNFGIPQLDRMLAIATAFLQVAPNYRKFLSMYNRVIPKPGTTMLIPFPEKDDIIDV